MPDPTGKIPMTKEGGAAGGFDLVSLVGFTRVGNVLTVAASGSGTVPSGTGWRHVTGGVEDAAASTPTKSDVGLGNADNTSDASKPVSTAQAAAIAVVQNDVNTHEARTDNPHAVTKSQVGLGNVDNTSDVSKPVSTAQQAAIDEAVVGLWQFMGSGDASTSPNYPAAQQGDTYLVSVAGKIGGASGVPVSVGDVFLALEDNAGGTQAAVGDSWTVLEANIPDMSSDGAALISAANYAAMRALLDLEAGTDFLALSLAAPLASPPLTGNPTAPTQVAGNNSTRIATTAFVTAAIAAAGGGTVTTISSPDGSIVITDPTTTPTVAVNPNLFKGVLWGATLSNNGTDPTNDIDIAAGMSVADDQSAFMNGAAMTCRLDGGTWVAGTNQPKLDTGTIANDWYNAFKIQRSDTGNVDYLFSASFASPTMPANYDRKQWIGAFLRETNAIVLFIHIGKHFLWVTPRLDVNVSDQGTSATSRTLSVPDGPAVIAEMHANAGHNTLIVNLYVRHPDQADQAPSLTANPLSTIRCVVAAQAATGGILWKRTNTSGQVTTRSDQTATFARLTTISWLAIER